MSDKTLLMSLDDILGDRFGRYSKYIIQDRALPDVRDGLKPVQRRILYAMYKEGNLPTRPYRKSAKTVGNVIGNYHPHGDTSVYEAMVRLSQEWKMRMPLVDMQGNNGSIDNDPAAAMRYTEARLAPIAMELLQDLDKETVNMALNFDDTEYEPTVLPAKYPNLLINGATGISAGYATDIPPHNLEEVIDATVYRIRHPHCDFDKLLNFIKGPDFPTGAIVEGKDDIVNALKTGRGKVTVRSKTIIKETAKMNQIIITEIPYEVNKADLVRKMDEIRFNRDVDGIIEVRDESDRQGLRIVVDVKKDVDVNSALNYFFKNTDLQKNYNYNMVAIKDKRPEQMGIDTIIDGYIDHEIEVVTRRCQYELDKARAREHIVEGLILAISILDEVVATIRRSRDKADAKINLQNQFGFTERQAEAIVMLQLYRLTNTDIVALEEEQAKLKLTIARLEEILGSEKVLRSVIIDELKDLKKRYPTPRLTEIKDDILDTSIDETSMIIAEDVYVSLTRDGYIKRISKRSYNASTNTAFGKKDDDYLVYLGEASTLDVLLAFTNKGSYVYIPVYKLEEFKWKDTGNHISYLIKIDSEEKFVSAILVRDFSDNQYLLSVTKNGQIKRTVLSDYNLTRFTRPSKAMNLKGDDELLDVLVTDGTKGVVLVTRNGYATLYNESEISITGAKAAGIRAISLKDDEVVSISIFDPGRSNGMMILTNPPGLKRIHVEDIPVCRRATKGTSIIKLLKTKPNYVVGAIIGDPGLTFKIATATDLIDVTMKNYNFAQLSGRASALKDIANDAILDIFDPRMKVIEPSAEKKIQVEKVEQKPIVDVEVKEAKKDVKKTRTEKDETKEIVEKPKKKTRSKVRLQKQKEVHFEPISFDDIFGTDDF
ncbi:MAG: DNA topoisomerase IV subunit A [Erysipelotrichaceae bacterium]|nr:DNA topoisomerase IV subunit A [Erysipelotrichaceae bacterium]